MGPGGFCSSEWEIPCGCEQNKIPTGCATPASGVRVCGQDVGALLEEVRVPEICS